MPERSTAALVDDLEEPADRHIHRPLARQLVRRLAATSITPNQVTLLSGASGVLAAAFVAASPTRPAFRAIAAVLLLASAALDCADGQLARLRGHSSPEGGALDGIADEVVGFTVIVACSFVLHQEYGGAAWLLGAIAMLSSSLQCLMFDAAKERYVATCGVQHGASKIALADRHTGTSSMRPDARSFLLRIFDAYVRRIRWIGARLEGLNAADRELARRRIRGWTTLGLGTHMACGYAALALSAVWLPALYACLLVFAVVMNVQLGWFIWRDRRSMRVNVA